MNEEITKHVALKIEPRDIDGLTQALHNRRQELIRLLEHADPADSDHTAELIAELQSISRLWDLTLEHAR